MEWILILILAAGGGYQLHENGELEQRNAQLEQTIKDQNTLVESCYAERRDIEQVLTRTKNEYKQLAKESIKRTRELEELRNSSPDVADYLSTPIPDELSRYYEEKEQDYSNRVQDPESP